MTNLCAACAAALWPATMGAISFRETFMHHWSVDGEIYIGWPDHGAEERRYTIVDLDRFGKVFRARGDGRRAAGRVYGHFRLP